MKRIRSFGHGRFGREADEAQLQDTRALLDAALDHAPLVFYAKDDGGRFTVVNTEFERIAGRPRREIVGRTGEELAPADGERFSAHEPAAAAGGDGTELFEEVVGGRTYVSVRFPLTGRDGRLLGVAGASRRRARSPTGSASSAAASRSTTSGPASAPSTTSSTCRSTT
jgi:PAS domain S-box-containing protein